MREEQKPARKMECVTGLDWEIGCSPGVGVGVGAGLQVGLKVAVIVDWEQCPVSGAVVVGMTVAVVD